MWARWRTRQGRATPTSRAAQSVGWGGRLQWSMMHYSGQRHHSGQRHGSGLSQYEAFLLPGVRLQWSMRHSCCLGYDYKSYGAWLLRLPFVRCNDCGEMIVGR
jgi:hypothetical protein